MKLDRFFVLVKLNAPSIAMASLALVMIAGCHSTSSSSGEGPQPTTYEGTFTGSNATGGTLSLTIASQAAALQPALMPLAVSSASASGTIHIMGSGTFNLIGTFVPPSGPLRVSGAGYSLFGTARDGILDGTFAGPAAIGPFTALVSSSSQPVIQFCGSFDGTSSGTWNLSQSGATVSGSFTGTGGSEVLTGTVDGSTIALTFRGGTALGSSSGISFSGTWRTTSGLNGGTFYTSSNSCTRLGPPNGGG
jgi:hypothetical protein